MRHLLYIVLLPLLFTSCKKEVYHSFTDEEEAFLVYNKGDVFKLKNEVTGEVIELIVTERYVRHIKDSPSGMSINTKTHYEHEGRVEFSGGNYSGYIYIYKDKIDQFVLTIRILIGSKTFGTSVGNSDGITKITIDGVTYNNVFEYSGGNNTKCYFSKEYGFIKLEDLDNGVTHVRVP